MPGILWFVVPKYQEQNSESGVGKPWELRAFSESVMSGVVNGAAHHVPVVICFYAVLSLVTLALAVSTCLVGFGYLRLIIAGSL